MTANNEEVIPQGILVPVRGYSATIKVDLKTGLSEIQVRVGRVPAVAESRDLFKDVGHYLPPDLVILTPCETRSADNFV